MVTVELKFRWTKAPKYGIATECFLGKFRLGSIWFDSDREKWCSYFDNAHTTERTHETETDAKVSVERQAVEAMSAPVFADDYIR